MNLYKPFALALDRVDFFVTHVRFRILDWVCEPETPTPADEKRAADRERLRRAFPVTMLENRPRRRD